MVATETNAAWQECSERTRVVLGELAISYSQTGSVESALTPLQRLYGLRSFEYQAATAAR